MAIGNENLEEAAQFKDMIKALERFYNQSRYWRWSNYCINF